MFTDIRFPDDISYGSAGGPVFSTDIVSNAGGYEKRNSNWATPRAVYNVAHGVKNKQQLDQLISFFRLCKGRATAFRFKDWSDYSVTAQPLGISDGVNTTYQLCKDYSVGQQVTRRILTKPVQGTVSLYTQNGIITDAAINYLTGMVTLATALPAAEILLADCEFDIEVRFETDQLVARLDDYGVYSWSDIPLVEVR